MTTPGRADRWTARVAGGLFVILCLVLVPLQALDTLREDHPPRTDAQQYVTIAYNLAHHGAASLSPSGAEASLEPTSHRVPGYPLLLAFVILADPDLYAVDLDDYFEQESQPRLASLRLMQILLLAGTALLAAWIAWEITASRVLAALTLGAVSLDRGLIILTGMFLSENLAVFLFTAFALCLVLVAKQGRLLHFALSGLLLAALSLTRPSYAYCWLPALVFFGICRAWGAFGGLRLRHGAVIFLACCLLPLGAWMGRNARHFGRFHLAVGEGVTLDVRAELNGMTPREGVAGTLYWSGSWYLKNRLLPRLFDDEAVALLEESNPESAYLRAYARRGELLREHGVIAGDAMQAAEARWKILRHPVRHLLATFPIAVRGMDVNAWLVNLLLFGSLIAALVLGSSRRDAAALAALWPAAVSWALHSLATLDVPRYSQPLVPVLWVAVAVVVGRTVLVEAGEEAPRAGCESEPVAADHLPAGEPRPA